MRAAFSTIRFRELSLLLSRKATTMRRIFFVNAAAASASVLVRDSFSNDGNLVGKTPNGGGGVWAAHS